MRISLKVFSWISFPQAPEYTISAVKNIFENSRRYLQLKVHHRCHWHRWQCNKFSIIKISIFLFGHHWVVELTYGINVFLQVHFTVSAVWYCSHYLLILLTLVANLPPVPLKPVVHINLPISLWILEKYRNDPNVIFSGVGEDDSWKKPEAKNLVTLSL
jgi:hypothetical protein